MKKMNLKKSLTLTAPAALVLSLLAGCGAQAAEQVSTGNKMVGTVLLSVNPKIEVEYDERGLVLEIEGMNDDGKTVVKDVKDYQGRDCRTVVGELDDAGRIGQNKAKELVLAQLGLKSASFRDHEYELDDGVYEFEFDNDGIEYEYEVDARTGTVLKADIDGNDDWDDRDDDQDD